jgi:lipid-A-disaccharide synthase-like uncharacterized protein
MDIIPCIQEQLSRFEWNTWKAIGLTGGALFGLRWWVQAHASKKAGRLVVPALFWYMSLLGAAMQLAYFVFYRFDSVGFLATFPPTLVAAWNVKKFYLNKPATDKPADELDDA